MIAVAGVDSATKNLGLACTDGHLVTLNARAGASDPIRRLAELKRAYVTELRRHPPMADLFVVEGYLLHGPGRISLLRLGEVGGMVRTTAFDLCATVVEVSPQNLKRFATGNGGCSKGAMLRRAAQLGAEFSRPVTGNEKTDPHDEADAFLARRLGLIGTGQLDAEHDHEREIVAAYAWPVT